MSCYYFGKSRKLSIVNIRPCEHFVKISQKLLLRSRTIIWHPAHYFVTSFCDNWQLCDGWKIVFRQLVDDSVKIFDQKWQLCDSYRVVLWWLRDYFVTSICEGTTIQQLYDNLQIITWRPYDHTVSCNYTMTTLNIENKRSSIWQICRHWRHHNLPLRQLTVPPVMTMLSNWPTLFSVKMSHNAIMASLWWLVIKVASHITESICIEQLHGYDHNNNLIVNTLFIHNKANLRDLIIATGLVTLFGLCDLEIWPMALKNKRDFRPCPFQLCVSFHSYQCIQLGLTVRKRSNRVKIIIFLSPMTTKIGQMTLKNKRAPLLCLFYFHASCLSHQWIQLWVTVQKRSNWVKIGNFLPPVTLKFPRWLLTRQIWGIW